MANATVSRLGQVNADGDALALFLKVFSGEVLTAFEQVNKIMPLTMVKTITSGKSASFPATGIVTAGYHTPGAEIVGQTVNHNERVISIDGLLKADTAIAEIDEAMNHYDVRSEYTRKIGHALALQMDKNLLQVLVLAARASATVTGGSGGSALTNADYRTNGETLAAGIFSAAQTLDEKDIPDMDDRYCAIKPAQYHLLAQTTKVINKDWSGSGSYADGKVLKIDNVTLVKTNNLPTSAIDAVTGQNNTYNGTFTNTAFVVWNREAAGTVKLRDVQTETAWDIRRQVWLTVGKVLVGHGILRPECAVEGKVA